MDLAGPDQVILEAIGYGADFKLEYCTISGSISSSSGLPIGMVKNFEEVKIFPNDYLIIPGSNFSYLTSPDFKKQKKLISWLNEIHQRGIFMVSICSGAFALAQAGLLDGLECTTHFKRTKDLKRLFPKAKVLENILYTESNGIYTSAGIAAGIDLALYILEKLKGTYFAHKVARELVIYSRRNGNQKQESELMSFRNHIHSGIHMAQDWLHENLHLKPSISTLAEIAHMSTRNFTRLFRKESSISVHDYITHIRKEKIRELLKKPDLSKKQIANKCGLRSERQLIRLLERDKLE